MVVRLRTLKMLLSVCYIALNYDLPVPLIHFSLLQLILLPTLMPLLHVCRMDSAVVKSMLEKVIHKPWTYASHRQGLIPVMERVLQKAGINQSCIKLSSQEVKLHSYFTSYTVVLVVMPDQEMPEFSGEMVICSSILLATAIQSAARGMTRRILAWFWNTKFGTSEYRLIPRAIFDTEDVMATHLAIAKAAYRVQRKHQLLISTTGSYQFHVDCLLRNMEKECHIMQDGFATCVQRNQALEEEVQRVTRIAQGERKD